MGWLFSHLELRSRGVLKAQIRSLLAYWLLCDRS